MQSHGMGRSISPKKVRVLSLELKGGKGVEEKKVMVSYCKIALK